MDLTVEIQGDAASLEECLEQFTVREWLHGDNMYKCDGYELFAFHAGIENKDGVIHIVLLLIIAIRYNY